MFLPCILISGGYALRPTMDPAPAPVLLRRSFTLWAVEGPRGTELDPEDCGVSRTWNMTYLACNIRKDSIHFMIIDYRVNLWEYKGQENKIFLMYAHQILPV